MPRKKNEKEKARTGKAVVKKAAVVKADPKKAKAAPKIPKASALKRGITMKSGVTKIEKKATTTAGAGKMKKEISKKTGTVIEKKTAAKERMKTPPAKPKRAPLERPAAPPEKTSIAPPQVVKSPPPPPRLTTAKEPVKRQESSVAETRSREPEAPAWRMSQEPEEHRAAPSSRQVLEEVPPLPQGYGETRIVLMPIDPDWVHAYWEVTGASLDEARRSLGHYFEGAERALRVRRIDGSEGRHTAEQFYVNVGDAARNWYIKIPQPDSTYQADIGLKTSHGDFYVLATSNAIRVPRKGMSDVIDEKWTNPAKGYFEKVYALSGGFQVGMGSLELQQKMEELMRGDISSGAVGSFAMGSGVIGAKKERAFWLRVGAELIVYGATDSRAKVTLMGQPVQLRPDGTFSARFALPDGVRDIPITALSPDGIEEREIRITVTRETLEKEPVLK
jgi:hypothetical protein